MELEDLKQSRKVQILIHTEDGQNNSVDCQVKEVYQDRVILHFGNDVMLYSQYLQEGEDVEIRVFTPEGIRVYSVLILDSPLTGAFVIEYPDEFKGQIQRRKYLRVNLKTKIIIQRGSQNIVAKTVDVSAGAVRFSSDEIFQNDEYVSSLIYFPGNVNSVPAEGMIMKKDHLPQNEYVLFFTKINDLEKIYINDLCVKIKKVKEISSKGVTS